MKCLVTGAGGFIGSHLCEELISLGHEVTAFVHYNSRGDIGNLRFLPLAILRKIKILKGDIQDPFSVEIAVRGHTYVFHLAALIGIPYSYIAPTTYVAVNVQGTLNVLEASRKNKAEKVIHTSTSETYGSARYVPIDEKHPLQGQSPYSASKIGADQVAESYYRSFGMPIVIVRPFNTFGPRQSARAVIPTIISQILQGEKEIRLGSLKPIRDFNYVKNTVAGFIGLAFNPYTIGKTINIGSGKGHTVRQTFEIINGLTNMKTKIKREKERIRPEMSEVNRLICDYSLAKRLVGYKPKWTFEEGLKETIDFIKKNLNLYTGCEYVV